jgi:hypothetical protein
MGYISRTGVQYSTLPPALPILQHNQDASNTSLELEFYANFSD